MDNIQISHVDGELPIYREMKPVPVTLENCILNNDEDYLYSQNVQPLETKYDYVNDELSAEDIKSMIMINEGPHVLSSVQEELDSSKSNLTLQNNSDIKKILTCDLPKAGRFLSTKSLKKLSGAKNVLKKNSKYSNKKGIDVGDFLQAKVKKNIVKEKKINKAHLGKIKSGKIFKNKIQKKSKKIKKKDVKEKLFMKEKDSSSVAKTLKKGAFKRKSLLQEREDSGSDEEKGSNNSQTDESSFKMLISRSGRLRKVKNVTKDFVIGNKKEEKILNPDAENKTICGDAEKICEFDSVNGGRNSKGVSKGNKVDLLQNVLSESVESWFDIAEVAKKKSKRGRGRIKINPKEPDTEVKNFELIEDHDSQLLEQEESALTKNQTEESALIKNQTEESTLTKSQTEEPDRKVNNSKLIEDRDSHLLKQEESVSTKNQIEEPDAIVVKTEPESVNSKLNPEESTESIVSEIKAKEKDCKKPDMRFSTVDTEISEESVEIKNKNTTPEAIIKDVQDKTKNIETKKDLKETGNEKSKDLKRVVKKHSGNSKIRMPVGKNFMKRKGFHMTVLGVKKEILSKARAKKHNLDMCKNNETSEEPAKVEKVNIKTEIVENKENEEVKNYTTLLEMKETPTDEFTIPLKKRASRDKTVEALNEVKDSKLESQPERQERRKSHREIKLTPKLVDMIATSTSYKRTRKVSTSKEEPSGHKTERKETDTANPTKVEVKVKQEENSDQSLPLSTSMENYLQSKMEANASNFKSLWSPGDLVWARFAGNPFWPSLILRDPFSNDEYSAVKYLGRLPRPFVHVQFLADFGRRAWGPELYIMSFEGLEKFEIMKANLPEVNAFTNRKDLIYQRAFFTPKKLEKNWLEAVKEAEALLMKSNDERITYMNIKYPLVRYAESVANGRLVSNERVKPKKRKSSALETILESGAREEKPGKKSFDCANANDEETKRSNLDSPKITLKLIRSPNKGSKRRLSKPIDVASGKKYKKRKNAKEDLEEDYAPSDSGSSGEKGPELAAKKKFQLFKGARTEKVCQICFEKLENEKTMKCKGPCLGLFHKSCAEKMNANLPPLEEGLRPGIKKRRKKLFSDDEINKSADTEKDWRCSDCLRGENPCFICKNRSGNRQRCCVGSCGKFYHQKCLKLYPHTSYNHGAPLKKSQFQQQNKTESESPHYQILSCPLHVCHTCASDNPIDFNVKHLGEKLVKCIKCPSAYHGGNYCVPAGSVILNTTQIICVKHEDPDKRSHVNISWCFICNMGGSLICCEWCPSSFHLDCLNIKPPEGPYTCEECDSGRFPLFGEIVWVKLGRFRWWPARILYPQEIQTNIMALPHKPWEFAVRFYGSNDHYWLNRGRVFLYQEGDSEQKFRSQKHVDKVYQKAVQDASKEYAALKEERKSRFMESNNSSSIKPPPYVKIKTNKAVGKVQLGNLSQSEPQTCDCDPNSEAPCKPGSDCLNRMLLVECNPNHCNAGPRCRNQSFEKREYPPLEAYKTENRGWGLRSLVDIAEGSFVIEYVGEVVDYEEFKRRMKRKLETKDSNYYFLTIDKDRMIDAGPKGNLARFMNHSCSPNCETQKWTVNGDTRVGLFALRDIPAGTELTFNYNLDCIGNEKKVCNCEEENCSGFIGVKAKNEKSENLKSKGKRMEKDGEDECFICNDGGELMLCDVPNCPKVYHLECVNLTEWPNEIWFCPRHSCCICKRTTKRSCRYCPAAYCFSHLDNNLFSDNQGGLLCGKHSAFAVKPSQTFRKASYVNRSNSPAIEYEKPFIEKYRPPKGATSPKEIKQEILMEPNLTDNTPIVVENPLLSQSLTPNRLSDGVSVEVFYVDEEGEIVSVDTACSPNAVENVTSQRQEAAKPLKRRKRTNIPRKKLNPPTKAGEAENKQQPTAGGINFESLMIKSVENKILDSKLNMDNIYNIIGGGGDEEGEAGQTENSSSGKCVRDDMKQEAVIKKEDTEVDRSRRSKYFKIITPEKFIKVKTEGEANQKKVTDFNYIEFMHPLRSARSKVKGEENPRK